VKFNMMKFKPLIVLIFCVYLAACQKNTDSGESPNEQSGTTNSAPTPLVSASKPPVSPEGSGTAAPPKPAPRRPLVEPSFYQKHLFGHFAEGRVSHITGNVAEFSETSLQIHHDGKIELHFRSLSGSTFELKDGAISTLGQVSGKLMINGQSYLEIRGVSISESGVFSGCNTSITGNSVCFDQLNFQNQTISGTVRTLKGPEFQVRLQLKSLSLGRP